MLSFSDEILFDDNKRETIVLSFKRVNTIEVIERPEGFGKARHFAGISIGSLRIQVIFFLRASPALDRVVRKGVEAAQVM